MAAPSVTPRTDDTPADSARASDCPGTSPSSWTATAAGRAQRGVPEAQGHAAGVEAIRPIVEHAADARHRRCSPSTPSAARTGSAPADEVEALIGLLEAAIRDETPRLIEEGVQVRLAGRLDELPPETRASIEQAILATADG